MRQLTEIERQILESHERWLEGKDDGERADMCGADLRESNMRGADLDFSCWPLHCGSINVIADDRLFAQLFYHLTRLDVSHCSGGVRESMEHLRAMAAADLFCEYRCDLKPLEDTP